MVPDFGIGNGPVPDKTLVDKDLTVDNGKWGVLLLIRPAKQNKLICIKPDSGDDRLPLKRGNCNVAVLKTVRIRVAEVTNI